MADRQGRAAQGAALDETAMDEGCIPDICGIAWPTYLQT